IYDWYLGGAHNFEPDRQFGRKAERIWPQIRPVSRNNRAFMQRVIWEASEDGITQFLDIGSGVPTVGNVHEVALRRNPDARVVYVDYEPVAFASGTIMLNEQDLAERATIIQRDLRVPEAILDHPATNRILDLSQPVCLLMTATLHFIAPQDHPSTLIARFRDRLAPGSWFAVSHLACDAVGPAEAEEVIRFAEAYQETSNPLYIRDREEIATWFAGFELLDPGVVFLPDWRPDHKVADTAARPLAWCGAGRKP
ncbi:MAG: SAM-dependent methyltransferase, partial [Sciscionella sp.]